jgi:hypothetical protein
VAVDEHEAGLTGDVTQRRHGGEQHGTVSAVDEREAARRECRAHARVQCADHPKEGWLVEQSRAGGAFSAGLGQDEVGLCHYLAPGECRLQPRGAQRLWCPGLRGGPTHAVEWHPDEFDGRHDRSSSWLGFSTQSDE